MATDDQDNIDRDQLDDVVYQIVVGAKEYLEYQIMEIAGDCESPIEKRMLLAMIRACWDSIANQVDVISKRRAIQLYGDSNSLKWMESLPPCDRSDSFLVGRRNRSSWLIEIQKEVEPFRVDFMLSLIWVDADCVHTVHRLVVECDGHDYHEKTKEQARKDKSRDREMKVRGLNVFRFTGSEIFADANACATQATGFIESLLLKSHVVA